MNKTPNEILIEMITDRMDKFETTIEAIRSSVEKLRLFTAIALAAICGTEGILKIAEKLTGQ